ncbi:hypothetical protein TeGR_g13335 [Tetraparma gracilis]|uniref:Cytokinin riboside 5'-monophosphate phosphoribohydrolase n=1 Tax=Tetraparma gracilis TaxID=2962635 RepID=A0ABQ6MTW9_9STRA|nr:hypothetical protein TeGR_g13335 [Tetraparma gracilis]
MGDSALGPKPTKAYKNSDFLMTRDARDIRVLCEQRETETRLDDNGIKGTVLFFGSARSKTKAQFAAKLEAMKAAGEDTTRFAKTEWMCDVHENLTSLAEKVGTFLKTEEFKHVGILTGGGPGMMEAANQGAFSAIPERSIGMGISLPFEPSLNPFVTPDLAFEFHYFFTRKFWMVLQAMALVVAPGGVGTMDELFEVMTLQQCGKIKIKFPIILFGKEYWEKVVNWDFMVERGVVSQVDVDALFFTDSVDDAYSMIVESLKHQLASVGFGPKGAAAPAPPAGSPLVPRAPRDPN